jgi:hypothetical protein
MSEEEHIRLYPVAGWQLGLLPEENVMLALHYVQEEPSSPITADQIKALSEVVRFGMTVAQCDDLALSLQIAAMESRKRNKSETLLEPDSKADS